MSNNNLVYLRHRLDEIKQLEPGWLDGDGQAIDPRSIDAIWKIIQAVFPDGGVHVFPMEEGGVSIEYIKEDTSLTIDSYTLNGCCAISINVVNLIEFDTGALLDIECSDIEKVSWDDDVLPMILRSLLFLNQGLQNEISMPTILHDGHHIASCLNPDFPSSFCQIIGSNT